MTQGDAALEAGREALLDCFRRYLDQVAPGTCRRFIDRLMRVSDRGMRSHALVQRLRRFDAHLSLALLSGIVDRSIHRDRSAQELLLDLTTTRPLLTALGYEQSRAIYELAQTRNLSTVARMLLSPESLAGKAEGATDPKSENKHLPDFALGTRKAMARGRNRLKLDRLLFDRHPGVIANLLNNPIILERDVVRVAAMRPTNGDVLNHVFRHPKWIVRYRVKVALALNPYTPLDIAVSLLPHLMLPELRRAHHSRVLQPAVREAAGDLIQARGVPLEPEATTVHYVGESGAGMQVEEGGVVDLDLDAIARSLDEWMADPSERR